MQNFRDYLESPTRLKGTLMPTGIAEGADIRSVIGGPLVKIKTRDSDPYSMPESSINYPQGTIWWAGQPHEDVARCGHPPASGYGCVVGVAA